MDREPYRVLVWGPGGLGSVCIYEVTQSPHYELVGVRAYSAEKNGIDAGTLIGIDPIGLKAIADADEALKIDCDCVVYTARDYGNYSNDEEILKILAAGRNVVTALPYQHAHLVKDAAFMARLHAACEKGQSTFHATGVDPDIIGDRVLMALTCLCNDIDHLQLTEIWDSSYTPVETLVMCGFGKTVEDAKAMPIAEGIADNFLRQVCLGMGEALGVTFSKVTSSHDYIAATVDVPGPMLSIKAGTVGRVTHRWNGFTDKNPDKPFFVIEVNWILGDAMLPPGAQPNQYWIATIEGRPSVKMTVDVKASIDQQKRFISVGKNNSEPGYHATIAACLQAIPSICAAAPGVLPPPRPSVHWRQNPLALR